MATADARPLISQGAEARVRACRMFGRDAVEKERFPKMYRHPDLNDKLTRQRVNSEARNLIRARKLGVAVPSIYAVDYDEAKLVLERIVGEALKEVIRREASATEAKGESTVRELLLDVGAVIARMHDGSLVHGDLTTSNIMIRNGKGEGEGGEEEKKKKKDVVMIDFGLAYTSTLEEDKAVDMYVLERAFKSAHAECPLHFQAVLDGYSGASKHATAVLKRLDDVRARGRKRTMVG